MEKQKRNDVAALLRYAGGHKGLTFLCLSNGLWTTQTSLFLSFCPETSAAETAEAEQKKQRQLGAMGVYFESCAPAYK